MDRYNKICSTGKEYSNFYSNASPFSIYCARAGKALRAGAKAARILLKVIWMIRLVEYNT